MRHRDRLADGFRSFGIGVVVMDRHDTPVPHGYFHATAMLHHAGEIAVAVVTRPTLFAGFSISKSVPLFQGTKPQLVMQARDRINFSKAPTLSGLSTICQRSCVCLETKSPSALTLARTEEPGCTEIWPSDWQSTVTTPASWRRQWGRPSGHWQTDLQLQLRPRSLHPPR